MNCSFSFHSHLVYFDEVTSCDHQNCWNIFFARPLNWCKIRWFHCHCFPQTETGISLSLKWSLLFVLLVLNPPNLRTFLNNETSLLIYVDWTTIALFQRKVWFENSSKIESYKYELNVSLCMIFPVFRRWLLVIWRLLASEPSCWKPLD